MTSAGNRRADGERTLSPKCIHLSRSGTPMVGKNISRFDSGRPTTLPESGYSPHTRGVNPRGSLGVSTPPSRSPNVPLRAGTMVDETRSLTPLLLVGDSASTPPSPRWCNGSTPVFGTVRRGSNPRRGAKPDHRKSDDSAFPHGNRFFPLSHLLIRSMRNARGPSTGFLTFPVAPESQGIRRPPCSRGNGRHRRLNQPALASEKRFGPGSTPAIASHRIRAKRGGYMPSPTLVSDRAQIRHGWMRALRPIAPDGNGGDGMRAMHSDPIPP